jgi:methanogenic corrinoid protein MtbC1
LINPELKEKYKEKQIQLYLEDCRYHLSYLAESISAGEPILFHEYLGWAKTFFANLPVTEEEIIQNLELMRDTIAEHLPPEMSLISNNTIDSGIVRFRNQPAVPSSFIVESNPLCAMASEYLNYLINGDKKSAHDLILDAVNSGVSVKDIYINIFQVTQKETGRLWQMSKIGVAQEHFITAATQLIMSRLYPYLFTGSHKGKRIIVSCVNGELHELAPRMVADLFELDGWDSYYFGANTPQSSLIEAVKTYKPHILAVSATMTFNISAVTELIEKVKSDSATKDVKVFVGGYPFMITENLWKNIGADGFAVDALLAIQSANDIIN